MFRSSLLIIEYRTILYSAKTGYLPNCITENTLNIVFNDIILYMDNEVYCYLALLNLSSIFDTLNHRVLSYRIREIGIMDKFICSLVDD